MTLSFEQIMEKLQLNSKKDELTGCLLWQGGMDSGGYGWISIGHETITVHRISAVINLKLNPLDKTQWALHKLNCPNRNCWNPEHLYVGSRQENNRDRYFSNPRTHCKQGHEYTPENTYFYKSGSKACLECQRQYRKARYKNDKAQMTETVRKYNEEKNK